jgi:hypothetical protein
MSIEAGVPNTAPITFGPPTLGSSSDGDTREWLAAGAPGTRTATAE